MSRVFGAFWRGLNLTRQIILNLIFFLLLLLLIIAMSAGEAPTVPNGGALVVAPQGQLVEQYSADPVQQAINNALGQGRPQTLLRTLTGAIETAADDERISVLVLKLDNFAGGALPQLREVADAIETFKESGKPVIAIGDRYTQSQYFIAAHADTIMMHPLGSVVIRGLGFNQIYYKELSNQLGIDWNVVRVGDFKSAVEPMIRNDMSPEARKNYSNLLGDLWATYQAEVTQARDLPPATLEKYVANLVEGLRELKGNAAELALMSGLVDTLVSRETMRQHIIEIAGEDTEFGGYRGIYADTYYKLNKAQRMLAKATKPRVAVIVASGVIMPGHSGPNRIGADDLAARINDAVADDDIKAIVLRVHSPGGSAFASEIIHDALLAAKASGKPVVVSMSGVAASGGYWISLGADQIWAYP
ncbi:MAG TPA: signal peptide peptidase SppA, partial [Gammaproteobacteria bacterium]|nr:signal peptide peptidase SppA [Gammaproteobacteria bacterium]